MKIQFELLIDNRIINLCKKIFNLKTAIYSIGLCFFIMGLLIFSEPITKPYTFARNTEISSAEVNENFDALYTLINQHDSSITSLQEGGDGFWVGDSSSISYMGNVGIGTINPAGKVNIIGALFLGDADTALDIRAFDSAETAHSILCSNSTTDQLQIAGLGNGIVFQAKDMGIAQVIIDNDGNVGIGTSSPTTKFDVAGVIRSDNAYSSSSPVDSDFNGTESVITSVSINLSGQPVMIIVSYSVVNTTGGSKTYRGRIRLDGDSGTVLRYLNGGLLTGSTIPGMIHLIHPAPIAGNHTYYFTMINLTDNTTLSCRDVQLDVIELPLR